MKKWIVLNIFFLVAVFSSYSQEDEKAAQPRDTSQILKSVNKIRKALEEDEGKAARTESAEDTENKEEEKDFQYWVDQLRVAMEGKDLEDEDVDKPDEGEIEETVSEETSDEEDSQSVDFSASERADSQAVLKRLDRIERLMQEALRKSTEAAQRAGNAEALAKDNWKKINRLIQLNGGRVKESPQEEQDIDSTPVDSVDPERPAEVNDNSSEAELERVEPEGDELSEALQNNEEPDNDFDLEDNTEDTFEAETHESADFSEENSDEEITAKGEEGQRLEAAIQVIKETGEGWIQALQKGSSETAIDEAETSFHNAAGNALEVYREAVESGEDIDLLEALNQIHQSINQTQARAAEIREQN